MAGVGGVGGWGRGVVGGGGGGGQGSCEGLKQGIPSSCICITAP